jgi:hypothetical protein
LRPDPAKLHGKGIGRAEDRRRCRWFWFVTSHGKHSKEKIGISFTPERAFGVTIGLIVTTIVLHIVGRIFSK